jgi:hypothetical protein
MNAETPKFEHLVVGELRHLGDLAIGHCHQMPRRVRVFVHKEKRGFAAGDDEIGSVVIGLRGLAEEIGSGLVLRTEILDAPRRPEGFEMVLREGLVHASFLIV